MTEPPSKRRRLAQDFIEHEATVARDEEEEEYGEEDNDFIQNDDEITEEVSGTQMSNILKQHEQRRMEGRNFISDLESRYVTPAQRQDEDEEEVVDYRSSMVPPAHARRAATTTATRAPRGAQSVPQHMAPQMQQRVAPQAGVDKTLLIPTPKDPSLFLIRCKPGKEKEAALTVMQKYMDYLNDRTKSPLLITGAVALDHLQGYIYIEAQKEAHVRRAVDGISLIFAGRFKMVPLNEMTQVLDLPKENKGMPKRNDWVRMTRGIYKEDLARVLDVDETRGSATVQLVPRLELPGQQALNRRQRPPKRLFNKQEIVNNGGFVEEKRDLRSGYVEIYNGNKYVDGFLHKTVNIKSLKNKGVEPTIDELQLFSSAGTENLPTASYRHHEFKEGDAVRVIDGDLKDLTGRIQSVNKKDRTVEVIPDAKELGDQPLTLDMNDLTFNIDIGSFVQVTNGTHQGETGDVVAVNGNYVILYSREKNKEMEAFITDIKQVSHVTTNESYKGYALHDLVKLNNKNCGVILQVGNNSFKILDDQGIVKNYKYQEILSKMRKDNFSKKDMRGNYVGKNDTIKVVSGNHSGLEGVVKHVYRNHLFCHSRDLLENNGMFVTSPSNVEVKGGTAGASTNKTNMPAPSRGYTRNRVRTKLQGETVKITKGPYKGYKGTVKGAGANNVLRIELHSQFKVVNVEKNSVKTIETASRSQRNTSRAPSATPSHFAGSDTPFNRYGESHTPMHSTQTPLHQSAATTPGGLGGWDKNVPNTPYGNDVPQSPFNPTNPNTPGAYNASSTTNYSRYNTPGMPATTPGLGGSSMGARHPTTPGMPSMGQQRPNTPGLNAVGNSANGPYGGSTMTPGVPSYGQQRPVTPGMNTHDSRSYGTTPGMPSSYGRQNPVTPGNYNPPTSNRGPNQDYHPMTPGMRSGVPATPGFGNMGRNTGYGGQSGIPQTPGIGMGGGGGGQQGIPQTPGVGMGGMRPTTPGANQQGDPASSWIMSGIQVRLGGQYQGQIGVVLGEPGQFQTAVRLSNGQVAEVNNSNLSPVKPTAPGERVVVIRGTSKGRRGTIAHLSDEDRADSRAVVNADDANAAQFVVETRNLARLA